MAKRMGVKEFREKFTAIARDAREPVIVTNHDKVVGYYTPANREPAQKMDWEAFDAMARAARKRLEDRGIDVAARLKALGIEDDKPFDDPWFEGKGEQPPDDA